MTVNEPDVHHLGHPLRSGTTCCGISMPTEQFEPRRREHVKICDECVKQFKHLRNGDAPFEA